MNIVSQAILRVLFLLFAALSAVDGATFTVTTLTDNVPGSLRRAILDAASGDTIVFASNVRGTIVLTIGEISIPSAKDLTILGPGYSLLSVSGNYNGRIFNLPGNLYISGLTLLHGSVTGDGGAIYGSSGNGTISACVFTGNVAVNGSGGAIYAADGGAWVVSGCSFITNEATENGGAIFVDGDVGAIMVSLSNLSGNAAHNGSGGALSVAVLGFSGGISQSATIPSIENCNFTNNSAMNGGAAALALTDNNFNFVQLGELKGCAFLDNSSTEVGGGIWIDVGTGFFVLQDCTFSRNDAHYGGGIFYSGGGFLTSGNELQVSNSTLTSNTAGYVGSEAGSGGGIRINNGNGGMVSLKNTIVALNSAPGGGPDVSGDFNSNGYNLVGTVSGGTGFGSIGDQFGDPRVGAIGLYGGSTYSIPLLPDSPALDTGKSVLLSTDQRGKPRPIDFSTRQNAVDGDGSDIGSFEVQLALPYSTDFNLDIRPDLVLFNTTSLQSAIWYLGDSGQLVSTTYAPTLPFGYLISGATDFNTDNKPDYFLYHPASGKTAIWFMNNYAVTSTAYGPTITPGYAPVAIADVTGDGQGDLVLFNASTRRTAFWYLYRGKFVSSRYGPSIPAGYDLAAVADFNRDGEPDFVLQNRTTSLIAIWYLRYGALYSTAYGPNLVAGWSVVGASDMNKDGKVDLVLQNLSTRLLAYWFMDNNARTGTAYGPMPPGGWSLAAP